MKSGQKLRLSNAFAEKTAADPKSELPSLCTRHSTSNKQWLDAKGRLMTSKSHSLCGKKTLLEIVPNLPDNQSELKAIKRIGAGQKCSNSARDPENRYLITGKNKD
jgi:hypothetical protein